MAEQFNSNPFREIARQLYYQEVEGYSGSKTGFHYEEAMERLANLTDWEFSRIFKLEPAQRRSPLSHTRLTDFHQATFTRKYFWERGEGISVHNVAINRLRIAWPDNNGLVLELRVIHVQDLSAISNLEITYLGRGISFPPFDFIRWRPSQTNNAA